MQNKQYLEMTKQILKDIGKKSITVILTGAAAIIGYTLADKITNKILPENTSKNNNDSNENDIW